MAERPSVPKRLYEMARANLSSLFEVADRALADFSDEEIALELKRREEKKLREEDERRALEREELEAKRRAAARRSAEAEQKASAPRPRTSTRTSTSGARVGTSTKNARTAQSQKKEYAPPPKPGSGLDAKRLREIYATLEIPPRATFDEIKSSYRRLMRKYHPDLHLSDPKKHKAATALTMQLTLAYREIEGHLHKK